MAKFIDKITGKTSYYPSQGEVFYVPDSGGNVTFYATAEGKLYTLFNGTPEKAQQWGIDLTKFPSMSQEDYIYNIERQGFLTQAPLNDRVRFLSALGYNQGTEGETSSQTQFLKEYKPVSSNETITRSIDPNNPNSQLLVSSTQGTIDKGGTPQYAPAPTGKITNAPISNVPYPTGKLQPGDTGEEVKKLQNYLVSKDLMTQADVDTGYGTYGPKTTAAVAKLQTQLGVDNSTGVGVWGPRTLQAVQSMTSGGAQYKEGDYVPGKGTLTPDGTYQPTQPGDTGGTAGSSGLPSTAHDADLSTILANPNLTKDQRDIIQATYDATSAYDIQKASRLAAAISASFQLSDPYYKEQGNLVIDALRTGISQKEGDINFEIGQRQAALENTRNNVAASKDYLTFQQSQELNDLNTKREQDLQASQEQMANTGFTVSSRRNKAEKLITDTNAGLVQSSNRQFAYQTGNLDRSLTGATTDTASQIAQLQQNLKDYGQNLFRSAEEKLGSTAVGALGLPYTALGGISGQLPYQQTTDALASGKQFIF